MLSLQIVREFVYNNFTQVTVTKNGTHFHARCAICGDSKKNNRKKRFHLDWKNGKPVYQCWNCDAHGSFFKLYVMLTGCSEKQAINDLYKYNSDRIKATLETPRKPPEKATYIPVVKLNEHLKDFTSRDCPIESYLYEKYMAIIDQFVEDRRVPKEYKILYAYQGKFSGRLIVPIFDTFMNLVYFQARRLPGSDIQPKYKNPIAEKQNIILNKDRFRNDRCIVVTEGLLDAFMIGPQGTTCLGKSLSKDFLLKLKKYTHESIILAFDNDEEGQKSMSKIMKSDVSKMVKYFIMPLEFNSKDINKLRCDHNIDDMYSFVVRNSYELHAALMRIKFRM